VAFTLYSAAGVPLSYAHTWTDFYKGIDAQGPYYTCSFLFNNWADSDTVPNQMMGKTTLTGGTGGTITRVTPMPHPLSPNLWCQEANVEGVGAPVLASTGFPYYAAGFQVHAKFRVSLPQGVIDPATDPYGAQQIDPANPILWCSQSLDFDEELVTMTNSQAKWQSDTSTATGVPVVMRIGLTVMDLTFHRVPYLPVAAIRSLRGNCNSAVVLGGAVGCVLFKGARTSAEESSDGTVVQSVQYRFVERSIPWYSGIRPDTLAADVLTTNGTTPIVPTADLTPLLAL
jgi:hypothetical protein